MKRWPYWLKGARIGFWIGFLIMFTMIAGGFTVFEFIKPLLYLDILYLINRTSDASLLNLISIVLSYTLYGAIIGFIFGKLRNKQSI